MAENLLTETVRRLFGFEFLRHDVEKEDPLSTRPTGTKLSPVPPDNQDGALNIQYGAGGGYYGYYLDLDGTIVDDFQLINRYREMQVIAEVDEAIDQIINEMVIQDAGRMPVSINMDNVLDLDEQTKLRIQAEFDGLLKQLHFHKDAYSVVRQWYIDGRIYYHLIVDEKDPEAGIQELRIVDPRCIRKVREVSRKRHDETQMDLVEVQREYFVYNPMGFVAPTTIAGQTGAQASMLQYNGVKITKDSIAFCPSGLYDSNKRTVLSWLHKAIKPLNLMRMMEDSCVIYRVSRAPERRVFYIDVGNLPKQKAEQYLYDIMQKYRNKLVYDATTGDIRDDRKFMSIMEDFWLPRREGGKGTEIVTLPAGQNLSEMEDVDYFRRKLYRALGLPPSRIDPGSGFNLGRASEISRDELRFSKYIHRMQVQFNTLFDQLLEKQLRLKNVLTEAEWNRVKDGFKYTWQLDSYFEELKGQEMWTSRLNLLMQVEPYINKFFSEPWVVRNILKFTDDEWEAIREEFAKDPALFDGDGEASEDGNPFGGDDAVEVDEFGNPIEDDKLGIDKEEGDSPFVGDDEADTILKDTDKKGEEDGEDELSKALDSDKDGDKKEKDGAEKTPGLKLKPFGGKPSPDKKKDAKGKKSPFGENKGE